MKEDEFNQNREDEINIIDLLKVLLRYKLLIIIISVVIPVLVASYRMIFIEKKMELVSEYKIPNLDGIYFGRLKTMLEFGKSSNGNINFKNLTILEFINDLNILLKKNNLTMIKNDDVVIELTSLPKVDKRNIEKKLRINQEYCCSKSRRFMKIRYYFRFC